MKDTFPRNGVVNQANRGEGYGNLFTSYGIDYTTEPGRILNSPNSLNVVDQDDVATFDNPVTSFAVVSQRWVAVSDVVLRGGIGQEENPTSGWAIDGTASTPTLDYAESSSAYFNGSLIVSGVSGGGDLAKYGGSSWDNTWWTGTLAQSALSSNFIKPLCVGPNGRLYIGNDYGRRVYNVTTAGVVTKTGVSTLDLSDTEFRLPCMVTSSNRMWLGGRDTSTGSSVVVEWDMSLNETTANRVHYPGSHGVISIVIWDDKPVLMLSDGTMRFYDGSNFYSKDGASLPRPPVGYSYRGDYVSSSVLEFTSHIMHPRGSAIIDNLPHFLIYPFLRSSGGTSVPPVSYNAIAGIYCYDPSIGLYNRFPIERDGGTTGFGSSQGTTCFPGALQAVGSANAKFLASGMFLVNGSTKAVVLTDNNARTVASRGFFVLNPIRGTARDLAKKVEVLNTKFKNSSDRILLKYRLEKSSTLPKSADVTWTSSTVFTTTDTDFANVSAGDWIYVYIGNGAGCSAHVSTISYSNPTYTVTLDETITGVSASDTGSVIADNWRRLATFDNANTTYHDVEVRDTQTTHTFWLMVELRAAANSVVELDEINVS